MTEGCWALNIFTSDSDAQYGGVKLFNFPFNSENQQVAPATESNPIVQMRPYNLSMAYTVGLGIEVQLDGNTVISTSTPQGSMSLEGYFGLNVWQSSAIFDNVIVSVGN